MISYYPTQVFGLNKQVYHTFSKVQVLSLEATAFVFTKEYIIAIKAPNATLINLNTGKPKWKIIDSGKYAIMDCEQDIYKQRCFQK